MQTRKRKIVRQDIPFFADLFLSEKAAVRTHHTVLCVEGRLNYLIRWIAQSGFSIYPKQWTRDHALAYRKHLLESGCLTASERFTQAKHFFRYMVLNKFADWNPFDGIAPIPVRKRKAREPITEEEFKNLVEAVRPMKNGDQWATALTIGYYTGMAIGDSVHLKWNEIDIDACIVRRDRSKTDVRATIPFERGGELCQRLDDMRAKFPPVNGEDFVMPIIASQPSGWQNVFAKARELIGLSKEKTFHNFRATMASRLINGGVSSIIARRITGHSTLTVFDKYVTVKDEVLEKAVRDAGYISSAPKVGQEIAV